MYRIMQPALALLFIGGSFGVLGLAQPASAQTLVGTSGNGAGAGWASAWIDLAQHEAFSKGEEICLRVSGANWVKVRFLPVGASPSQEVGIEGGVHEVPQNGALEITLVSNHPRVEQISVHGGSSAWGKPFPEGNGEPTLHSAERLAEGNLCN